MLGLSNQKKCLCFMIVLVVTFLALITTNFTSHGTKDNHHYKLSSKASPPRNLPIDKLSRKSRKNGLQEFLSDASEKRNLKYKPSSLYSKNLHSSSISIDANPLVDELAATLNTKITRANIKEAESKQVCHDPSVLANSCNKNGCLQTVFPEDLKGRVSQLVNPRRLQLPQDAQNALDSMAKKVMGNVDFMILSAVSSNHFKEIQAFLKNVHETVYPHFKNFTLVIYNIGLTAEEKSQMVRFCQCQMVDFPFHLFPGFVRQNLCYSWKPVIIKAHLHQANHLVWADSSVRFDSDPKYLSDLLEKVKDTGVLLGGSNVVSPFRTYKSMYHFFGDEPCMYLNMYQVQATIGFYNREFFVDRAVLEPWAACALAEMCICPVNPKKSCEQSNQMAEAWEVEKGPIVYGLCHRFDQSAISLILHKLYQGSFKGVIFRVNSFMKLKRKDTFPYFESLGYI